MGNDNDCDKHLCSCQMTFISKLLEYLWAGATVNPLNYHGNADWNGNRCKGGEMPEVTTVLTVDQGHDKQFICCGFYPDRFSYNTDTWGCCESADLRNPFRHATQQCCASGEVVDIGDSC